MSKKRVHILNTSATNDIYRLGTQSAYNTNK